MNRFFSFFVFLAIASLGSQTWATTPIAPEAQYSYGRIAACKANFSCASNDICELAVFTSAVDALNGKTDQQGFLSLFQGPLHDGTYDENILVPAMLLYKQTNEGTTYSITTTADFPPPMSFTIGPIKANEAFSLTLDARRNYLCYLKRIK